MFACHRVAITMMVSAFWHGIHPGYYLSFITVPISMFAEEVAAVTFRKNRSAKQQEIFDWVNWFWKMRLFDYMCMSFLLLTLKDTLRYWASIYFAGHLVALFFVIVGFALRPWRARKSQDTAKQENGGHANGVANKKED